MFDDHVPNDVIRPIAAAVKRLGLELGPPLQVDERELTLASCIKCGAVVRMLATATPAVPFDVSRNLSQEPYLYVHGCFFDDESPAEPRWGDWPL